ncbi:tRNA threonylcarbamoyladenosine biosynthesis protein TsaB [Candidatus Annandia adelgestsuga]|uniref:tRNA threonylcarbamoyladenosine biosynthesis protein TsaB n=1 Tax=Candidatus Annandia adelgestsuga TaxID=1302411 RepID=A0A3S9J7P4_9ENTR|nr:tRNA (adenosine(37)-N6)-threonylcarbamoyltransferase complex dimerization subunit type 1 TsaB [Candidatus Annandia adelgestsuga]AZP36391.1 tRNA threonylcarbamoyladenosine biosynthesis protein TsaB [Candidatus Annandia adelgestsuga]
MIILIINISHNICSVALVKNKNIYYLEKTCYKNGNKYILFMIKKILNYNNITIKNINAISFLNGPGHFTNVRVNISVAQGLSFGMNIPLISISILDVIAYKIYKMFFLKKILSVINSDLNEIYIGKYQKIKGLWIINKKKITFNNKIFNNKITSKYNLWFIVGLKGYTNIKFKKNISNIHLFNEINIKDIINLTIKYYNKNNLFYNKNIYPLYLKNNFINY